MANFLNGSDLLVYIGSGQTATAVGYSRSCSISLSTNMADATTKSNNGFSESIPTTKSWEISVEGLGVWNENIKQFVDAYNDRTPLVISFHPTQLASGQMKYSGTAYLESLEISGEMEDGVTYSVSFKGSGALAITATV
jgi:TP901-1 family phage major tail protein